MACGRRGGPRNASGPIGMEAPAYLRTFGPEAVPVSVVASDSKLSRACDLVQSVVVGGELRLLFKGATGTGKTTLAIALASVAESAGVPFVTVPRRPTDAVFKALSQTETKLVICDDVDEATAALQQALLRTRRRNVAWLVTSTLPFQPPVWSPDDDRQIVLELPPFDTAPAQAIALADHLLRERMGLCLLPGLEDDVSAQLEMGPWMRNGHSVEAFIQRVQMGFELSGVRLDDDRLPLSAIDVREALLGVVREEGGQGLGSSLALLAVEGETDKMLLEHAAALHHKGTGEDLLDGIEMRACDGATKIPASLTQGIAERRRVAGLFDHDEIGLATSKHVAAVGMRALVLPVEMGPMTGSDFGMKVEIEDLMPPALLEAFYAERPHLRPETRVEHKGRLRIVPADIDKYELVVWCIAHGSSDNFSNYVQILTLARRE